MQITDGYSFDKPNENLKQLLLYIHCLEGGEGRELFWDMESDLSSLAFEFFSTVLLVH